ncbi:hypothetical protein CDAR_529501 [Caerostris darwini]|uniref:Uncharacterized protein n=1 Tax=Caerostris darwini TaxID=1538125 RepID=A0AAV4SB01_9ARAC|nr:hypothetical protein CDAR_529501 [Caerostris darwini]
MNKNETRIPISWNERNSTKGITVSVTVAREVLFFPNENNKKNSRPIKERLPPLALNLCHQKREEEIAITGSEKKVPQACSDDLSTLKE